MPTYTINALVDTTEEDPGDGTIEKLIRINAEVFRDGEQIDTIVQRYGMDIDNQELRNALMAIIQEIVRDDYMALEYQAEQDRLNAIKSAIEDWSLTLP